MKIHVQKKLPIRKMFKNLFNGAQTESELSQHNNSMSSANTNSSLPTPQPVTDTVEHMISLDSDEGQTMHHESNLELSSLETWSSHEENADTPSTDVRSAHEVTESAPTTKHFGLHRVLREQLELIPECQAVAYVNINKTQLLAFETKQSWSEAVQPLIAAATSDLFLAPNTLKMIGTFQKLRDKSFDEVNYHQMTISADGITYVLLRAKNRRDRVAVFACRDSVALGMVLHHAHHALPKIEAAEDSPD